MSDNVTLKAHRYRTSHANFKILLNSDIVFDTTNWRH